MKNNRGMIKTRPLPRFLRFLLHDSIGFNIGMDCRAARSWPPLVCSPYSPKAGCYRTAPCRVVEDADPYKGSKKFDTSRLYAVRIRRKPFVIVPPTATISYTTCAGIKKTASNLRQSFVIIVEAPLHRGGARLQ